MRDVVQFYPIMLSICYHFIHWRWIFSSREN